MRLIKSNATAATAPPAVDLSPLPALLQGEYNYNCVSFIQDNLWTYAGTQYAVFWGSDKSGYITKRTLPDGPWSTPVNLGLLSGNPLAVPVTNDGHNSIVVGVDPTGNVHVVGNHHGDPLRYVRTSVPGDLSTFVTGTMTGVNENQVTYPQLVANQAGQLFLFYRNGGSGDGNEYIRRLDGATWVNPVPGELINGAVSSENPYMQHITCNADGFHLFWCWREDSTDAGSNTDITYMRGSQDGATWTTETGAPVTIPTTHAGGNIVFPTEYGSGLVNQNGACVDSLGRPHAVFHQYDVNGKTQIAHLWHNGTTWQNELLTTKLTHRMETVAQGLITVAVSRPSIVADNSGRVFCIFTTRYDDRRGTVRCIDATPGVSDRRDFSICDIDLWEWEPSYDTQAAKQRNELHMLIQPALNNAQFSQVYAYNAADNWNRQYGAVLSIDLAQMGELRAGRARIPKMQTMDSLSVLTTALVVTNTGDADIGGLGQLLLPKYLPRQKGRVLFARWRTRMGTVNTSGDTATFRLKLTMGSDASAVRIGGLPATAASAPMRETPWLPFPEWPLSDTLSWLVINGSTTNAAGARFTHVTIEVGYIDI